MRRPFSEGAVLRSRETPHDLIDLLPPLERKAYDIISSKSREGGITQIELWRILGIDSKEGSKIVLKLMRRGLVVRKEIETNGRKSYVLTLPGHLLNKEDLPTLVNINLIEEIPCFTCSLLSVCLSSEESLWMTCPKMSEYISRIRE